MPAEKFDFRNGDGNQLAALLDRPDGPVRAVALFAHCFTCGKDNKAARHIADGLKRHGIAVLRFDFTGLGASEGEFANTTFSSNIDDLVAAADHLLALAPTEMGDQEGGELGHDGDPETDAGQREAEREAALAIKPLRDNVAVGQRGLTGEGKPVDAEEEIDPQRIGRERRLQRDGAGAEEQAGNHYPPRAPMIEQPAENGGADRGQHESAGQRRAENAPADAEFLGHRFEEYAECEGIDRSGSDDQPANTGCDDPPPAAEKLAHYILRSTLAVVFRSQNQTRGSHAHLFESIMHSASTMH